MQKYEKSSGAFISERIGVIFGMPVWDDNARNLSSIFIQNDPLTNFMHIFPEILLNFHEKLRKLFFLLCDFPLLHIFCGACHSMSTVEIWSKLMNLIPFYTHLKILKALCAARRCANVAARTPS